MEQQKKEYTGFASYLEKGEITKEFIKDFEWWMRKFFKQWTLFIDFEEFQGICWTALFEKLPEFDPKVATIQTFCISRISNECWRLYMANKAKKPEDDFDDPAINCNIQSTETTLLDIPSIEYFNAFSERAYRLGVKVNINQLYADYVENQTNDGVKAFTWWYMKEKLSEYPG